MNVYYEVSKLTKRLMDDHPTLKKIEALNLATQMVGVEVLAEGLMVHSLEKRDIPVALEAIAVQLGYTNGPMGETLQETIRSQKND
jgi:hypothetical protein